MILPMATNKIVPKKSAAPNTVKRNVSPTMVPKSQSGARSSKNSGPVLGIDIGGSGIKGAPVDIATGKLTADRIRIPTPSPSTPTAVAQVVAELADSFLKVTGPTPIGCTFPGVVRHGTTLSAANVDQRWIGFDAATLFSEATGRPVSVINDAQAAVLAEVHYGAAKGNRGLVLMLTFGTGIGSGLAYHGVAIPGIELGHLQIDGRDAEDLASANLRETKSLSWKVWASRVQVCLEHIESAIWPELIIVGGGVSEKAEKWVPRLKTRAPIVVAALTNDAGIVGVAHTAGRDGRVSA